MKYPFQVRAPVRGAVRRRVRIEAPNFRNALERVLALNPNKFITIKFSKPMDYMSTMKEVVKQSRKDRKTTYYVLVDGEGECSISTEFHPEYTKAAYKNGNEIALPVDAKETANLPKKDKRAVKNPNALSAEETGFIKFFSNKGNKPDLSDKAMKTAERLQTLGYLTLSENGVELTKKGQKLADQLNGKTAVEKESPTKKVKSMSNSKNESMKTKTKKVAAKKKAAPKKATKKVSRKVAPKEGGKKVNISIKAMIANTKKGFVYRDPQGVKQTIAYMEKRANQDYVREGMWEYKPVK